MTGIAASIELYDRVSSPINKMIGAIGNITRAFDGIERSMDNGFDATPIHEARRAAEQAALEMVELGNQIDDNKGSQDKFNRSVQSGGSAMDGLVGKVMGLVAAYASIQTVGMLVNTSDQLTQTTARIDMMNESFNELNGTVMKTDDLVDMIYQSAQNARGSFSGMADVVARFGNNARDAFSSQEEIVAFANLIQKQMTIAGTGTAEAAGAMTQLSQALGSGVLRGDELNSIFEQAPNLIQSIADYLGIPIGEIRKMAEEGQLTADIVKNAIFASADEINAKFESMPMTWNRVWTSMKNGALMEFQPVLDRINEIANSPKFQQFASMAISALSGVAMALLTIIDLVATVANFFSENWSIIEPIIYGIVTALGLYAAAMIITNTINAIHATIEGVRAAATAMATGATFAATAAQYGFNAALLACPLTWIIVAIIAIIALVYAVMAAIAKLTGIANSGFGVITGGINVVIQFFKNLGLSVANIALGIGGALAAVAYNFMAAFNNAICSIQSWFWNLLYTVMDVVEGVCKTLNKIPFVEINYSGVSAKADEYAAKAQAAEGNKMQYKSIGDEFTKGLNTYDTFQDGWVSDAFNAGAAWGDSFFEDGDNGAEAALAEAEQYGSYATGQVPSDISDIAGNTGAIKDGLDITSEELKYLRDIAEQEAINRFTTAEIKVEMTNNNSVSSNMDLDGVVDYLANGVNEAMEKAAEGVHV